MIRKIVLMCCLIMPLISFAAEIEFSYNFENNETFGYGFGKKETYDVAIRIDQPSLKGKSVSSLLVALPGGDKISDVSGWLTNELNLKKINGKYVNQPDITTQVGVLSDGFLTVNFPEPYVIDGPFYAGYSFTVDEMDEATSEPVIVADGYNENGLFIHSSKSKVKWSSMSESANCVSAMSVKIEGDFMQNSAAVVNPGLLTGSAEDNDMKYTLQVANHGLNEVKSIDYKICLDGMEEMSSVSFDTPIPPVWGSTMPFEINLPQSLDPGSYDMNVIITSVNGVDNMDSAPQTLIPVKIFAFIPTNRPLVEEYTGLWCGWCVRGYVALETMHERYPDKFVAIAYHNDDPMEFNGDTPNRPQGYPDAFIDRSRVDTRDIYTLWPKYSESSTPAEIIVDVSWTDETQTALKATSTTRFVEDDSKADYGISYILVIDGLTNPEWSQYNAYAPKSGEEPVDSPDMPGELGQMFTHGPQHVFGLTYNDVALSIKYMDGFPGSVPTQIIANEKLTHNCVFDLKDIENQDLLQDKNKLRVIAILIDHKKGRPVNCNTSSYPDGTGNSINELIERSDILSTEWFDVHGIKYQNPKVGSGLMIRVDRLSNGETRTAKHLF